MLQSHTGNVLSEIVAARRRRVEASKSEMPVSEMERRAAEAPAVRNYQNALSRPGINIIAECKKASPSEGLLRPQFNPAEFARAFERSGASALSVLTEPDFFQGSLSHLQQARDAGSLPVLCKDFFFDTYQLLEARAAGADAFLLIVAILPGDLLKVMIGRGEELGMAALVETHSEEEIDRAVQAGAKIIGVNNRDLTTMNVDIGVSLGLAGRIPAACTKVTESGLKTSDDIRKLRAAGFDAFLIGTTFMRAQDPGETLASFLEA